MAVVICATICSCTSAFAAEKSLGVFGGWHVYTQNDGGQQVCYMVTTRTIKSTALKRGTPYLMITHRPTEASRDVISYGGGAALDEKHGVKLHIGTQTFDLFAVRDIAWARDPQTDHKIAALLQTTPAAQFSSYTKIKKKFQPLADRFDLKDTASAYRAIGKACGYIREPSQTAKKPKKKASASKH